MEIAQKNRLIMYFLKAMSAIPSEISEDSLDEYSILGDALVFLEEHHNDVLDFSTIETNEQNSLMLVDILRAAVEYNEATLGITHFSMKKMHERAQFWRRDKELATLNLPRFDFYTRYTTSVDDPSLSQLIKQSRARLIPLVTNLVKSKSGVVFDPSNHEQVTEIIGLYTKRLASQVKGSPEYQATKNRLSLLEDLNKINQLETLSIPTEEGEYMLYCSLAEKTEGVTEKVALISRSQAEEKLSRLITAHPSDLSSVDNYSKARDHFKLSTNAILKLPKHDDIKEVQREALALNISRILHHDTTRSSLMMHGDKPALFVPFEAINLLQDYATGQTFKAFSLSGKTYEHYSTINPLGNGLQGDKFIQDFGEFLGLFYLCSDTDAIGGTNQNKALRQHKSMYIFDQVIMLTNKLALDSRLSMQPVDLFTKHTRHGQGRNRTLIEDSSITNKFASILQLKQKQMYFRQYKEQIHALYQQRIDAVKHLLSQPIRPSERKKLDNELHILKTFDQDIQALFGVIEKRIETIDTVFPSHDTTLTDTDLRQVLILEKLLHNPTSFTSQGRPFKNPWTYRHHNPVKMIRNNENDSDLILSFEHKISDEMIHFIRRRGNLNTLIKLSDKEIAISRAELALLEETLLHPEQKSHLNHGIDYLNSDDLITISKAYAINDQRILTIISHYKTIMNSDISNTEKIRQIEETARQIDRHISTSKEQGFCMHVLKKLHFDNQKNLQKMMPEKHKPAKIDEAFAAALKLDRLSEFNEVIKEAVKCDQLTSPHLAQFLEECITHAEASTNYQEAHQSSHMLRKSAQQIIHLLASPEQAHNKKEEELPSLMASVDIIAHREEELEQQRTLVNDILAKDLKPSILEDEEEKLSGDTSISIRV